jgi:molybdopterin converting factor small subunit
VATIYFSSGLAAHTGGVESLSIDAPRVRELLEAVVERFPSLREQLELMAVAVDGQVHQQADYLPLSGDSEVHLVPRIAGGRD